MACRPSTGLPPRSTARAAPYPQPPTRRAHPLTASAVWAGVGSASGGSVGERIARGARPRQPEPTAWRGAISARTPAPKETLSTRRTAFDHPGARWASGRRRTPPQPGVDGRGPGLPIRRASNPMPTSLSGLDASTRSRNDGCLEDETPCPKRMYMSDVNHGHERAPLGRRSTRVSVTGRNRLGRLPWVVLAVFQSAQEKPSRSGAQVAQPARNGDGIGRGPWRAQGDDALIDPVRVA